MTCETHYDEGLEEIWRIKREIASEYASLDDYFKGMLAYQEERRKSGVKFVSFPPKRPEGWTESLPLSVAEPSAEYHAADKPPSPDGSAPAKS